MGLEEEITDLKIHLNIQLNAQNRNISEIIILEEKIKKIERLIQLRKDHIEIKEILLSNTKHKIYELSKIKAMHHYVERAAHLEKSNILEAIISLWNNCDCELCIEALKIYDITKDTINDLLMYAFEAKNFVNVNYLYELGGDFEN